MANHDLKQSIDFFKFICYNKKNTNNRRLAIVKIGENLASKIKNHPGFLAFWGKSVKTEDTAKKEKEPERGGVKR